MKHLGRRRARCALTFLSAASLAASTGLPACELVVGTDDFVTTPDAGGAATSVTGSTSTSGGTASGSSSSSSSNEAADASSDGAPNDGGKMQDDGGKAEPSDASDAAVDSAGQTGSCASEPGDSVCTACWKGSCCTQYEACTESTDCLTILNCIQDCTSTVCNCAIPSSQGLALYAALINCSSLANTNSCEDCVSAGVGDQCNGSKSCTGSSECLYDQYQADDINCTPTTCAGWCTPDPCTTNADCAGNFTNGVDENGQGSVCIDDPFSDFAMCYQLCGPGNSCAGVPLTTCQSDFDIDGNPVMACE